MLQAVLQELSASPNGPEAAAQRRWNSLLMVSPDARQELCTAIIAYFRLQESCSAAPQASPAPVPTATAFVDVFCAALFAIHANLAVPLAWHSAAVSRLRSCPALSSSVSPADAEALVRICEKCLLRTPIGAAQRFRCLLSETGMGVPLLSLVLDAYGTAVTSVLAKPNEKSGGGVLDTCLERLRRAADLFTLVDVQTPHLTIVHPILLHVARVGGRLQDALHMARQPIRVVQPMLTGVGLADYVAYYSEAALLFAACGNYAAAFYALTPVHSLPPVRGLSDRVRGRSYGSSGDTSGADAYFASLKMHRVDRQDGSAPQASASAASPPPPIPESPPLVAVKPSVGWYPWYRTQSVSTPHTYYVPSYRAEPGSEDTVEWKLIISPSHAELRRDEHLRAWAIRLSLVLLCVAFGGGSPRTVCDTNPDALHSDEKETDWRGMRAAGVEGQHLCFPSPLFHRLSETTRVSLVTLLSAAARNFSAELQVYYDLLRAVAQRDGAAVRALVRGPSSAVFTSDLTLPFAEALVNHHVTRHILLDVARVYSRVPLRLLLDRTRHSTTHAEAAPHTREVLRLLAQLCATGELVDCKVDGTAVESVVVADGFDQSGGAAVDATAVALTLPAAPQLLQLCARVVSPLMSFTAEGQKLETVVSGGSNAPLLDMLTQMQHLHHAIEAEYGIVSVLQ